MTAAVSPAVEIRSQQDLRSARTIKVLGSLSATHSLVYAILLAVWLIPGLPAPEFVFGLTHGLMWIGMSLICIAAATRRLIPVRTALGVAIIGGIGPFVGTYEFMRLRRNGGATTPRST